MLERDGAFFQRRHEIGFDGKETNVVELEAGTSSAPAITPRHFFIAKPTAGCSRCRSAGMPSAVVLGDEPGSTVPRTRIFADHQYRLHGVS